MKCKSLAAVALAALSISCGKSQAGSNGADTGAAAEADVQPLPAAEVSFDADSAYAYVARQVEFGPRVPGSAAHRQCGEWLASELRRHGAEVTVQEATLTAFDGTQLPARNIIGSFNPQAAERILLLAHWDTRPWADNDPDRTNHSKPVPGADDGASGTGVLLEIARQLSLSGSKPAVDILFTDAEDYGTDGDDESWALGTRYFVQNRPEGVTYSGAILLDMVGGKDAQFRREYFSQQYAPQLVDAVWAAAGMAGEGALFSNELGGAITDDHVELIKGGIPAIDIITFDPANGFPPYWHTVNDDMSNISAKTLGSVGRVMMTYLNNI